MKNYILLPLFCTLSLAGCNALGPDPTPEQVCEHTTSCFEVSSFDQCVINMSTHEAYVNCQDELKDFRRCMYRTSCEDILNHKACKRENTALKICAADNFKKKAQ